MSTCQRSCTESPLRQVARRLILVLTMALVASSAWAQAARVSVVVKSEEGELLAGVEVRGTQPDTGFDAERTTDKKGKAVFSFRNGALVHQLDLRLQGYQPLMHQFKPGDGNSTLDLVMKKAGQTAGSPAQGGAATGGGRLTPAQEVFNEGVVALQANDVATAEAKFQRALELDADMVAAHLALASVYLEQKKYDAVKASANAALVGDPQSARAYRLLYEVHTTLGEAEAAEKALAQLSKLESSSNAAAIVYNEGADALRLNNNQRGIERLEKALTIDPNLDAAMRLLAVVYQAEGESEKALAMADRYLVLQPNDARVQKLRYEALTALGRDAEAKAAFDALAAADPKMLIKDLFETGQKAFNDGDTEAALAKFLKIAEIDGQHPQTHYFLGLCYVNLGKNAEAKQHFETFLSLAPDDPQAATAQEMLGFLK